MADLSEDGDDVAEATYAWVHALADLRYPGARVTVWRQKVRTRVRWHAAVERAGKVEVGPERDSDAAPGLQTALGLLGHAIRSIEELHRLVRQAPRG